jgi:hypothetical protein
VCACVVCAADCSLMKVQSSAHIDINKPRVRVEQMSMSAATSTGSGTRDSPYGPSAEAQQNVFFFRISTAIGMISLNCGI